MNRDQALTIVKKYINNPNLQNHMLAVESAMGFYAQLLEVPDPDEWRLAGLLHDFDWEIHPSMELHPSAGESILRNEAVPEKVIRAILCHADHTGIPRYTIMEKALYACDEVTGLITAVALVRPSKSIFDLTSDSIKKKWKDRAFAAGANRDEIAKGALDLNISLWDHVNNVIIAMRAIAGSIGLSGSLDYSMQTPINPVKPQ